MKVEKKTPDISAHPKLWVAEWLLSLVVYVAFVVWSFRAFMDRTTDWGEVFQAAVGFGFVYGVAGHTLGYWGRWKPTTGEGDGSRDRS